MTSTIPVIIYTDGGCIGNPGPGGWAAVLRYGEHERIISGRFRNTTNNRMELRAAIEALETLKRPCPVTIYTDSIYLRDGITKWIDGWQRNGWRTANKKPVKNQDLWRRLLQAIEQHQSVGGVSWEWTKGHAGDERNEQVDDLANGEARQVTDFDPIDEEMAVHPDLFSSNE
ncbi:ribonuclease HI [Chloroflexi bacterium TSY]|nr:ribonuclease HI [Chloroflexi bacterium TSY]